MKMHGDGGGGGDKVFWDIPTSYLCGSHFRLWTSPSGCSVKWLSTSHCQVHTSFFLFLIFFAHADSSGHNARGRRGDDCVFFLQSEGRSMIIECPSLRIYVCGKGHFVHWTNKNQFFVGNPNFTWCSEWWWCWIMTQRDTSLKSVLYPEKVHDSKGAAFHNTLNRLHK